MTCRTAFRRAALALGAALSPLLSPAASAAEAVVVASTAPGYALGQILGDGTAVTVPDGAGVMLLFASGRTLRIKGPYAGPFDSLQDKSQDKTGRASLGGLLSSSERFVQTDLGAARALGSPLNKAAERAFVIDPTIAGTYCVANGTLPTLSRPKDRALSTVTLNATPITWTSEAPLPWPTTLPLADGAEIRVGGPDGNTLHTLRFHTLDTTQNAAALALRLAAAGCGRQAAALLVPLRDAVVPLDVYLAADRGPSATYRPGDAIRLVLQANRDAHVYCYLRNTRGQLIPLFPPGAGTSARIAADTPLTMPGERMPLPLTAAESGGDMEVRCVAADHDLGGDLPGVADAFRPMSDETVAQLDRALTGMRDTEVVMAQVILRVR